MECHRAFQDCGSLEESVFLENVTLPSCLQEAPGLVASPGKQTTGRADKQRIGKDALGPREEREVTLSSCSGGGGGTAGGPPGPCEQDGEARGPRVTRRRVTPSIPSFLPQRLQSLLSGLSLGAENKPLAVSGRMFSCTY